MECFASVKRTCARLFVSPQREDDLFLNQEIVCPPKQAGRHDFHGRQDGRNKAAIGFRAWTDETAGWHPVTVELSETARLELPMVLMQVGRSRRSDASVSTPISEISFCVVLLAGESILHGASATCP